MVHANPRENGHPMEQDIPWGPHQDEITACDDLSAQEIVLRIQHGFNYANVGTDDGLSLGRVHWTVLEVRIGERWVALTPGRAIELADKIRSVVDEAIRERNAPWFRRSLDQMSDASADHYFPRTADTDSATT